MQLSLVGLNHRTAPIEVRERLHFAEKDLPAALHALRERPGVNEALIFSTCNRVEVLARLEDEIKALPLVSDFLAATRRVARGSFEPLLYHHSQREAIRHVFRVASSLDSMVVGEPQVLGQVKAAYATARAVGSLGGILDEVLTRSFAVAKKVRAETGIATTAVSVSYAAVELARKIFGDLEGRNVFVIGAGKMSELAARHLLHSGAQAIFVANRTYARAQELAQAWGGKAIQYDDLLKHISQADIILSSTGAPHYIIKKEHGQRFLAERRNRPMFFIDIAVPRDIDPALNELDNIFVYDIDDLEQVIAANRRERAREAVRAEEIIEREVDRFLTRLKTLELGPTLVALQEKLHGIRKHELERARWRNLTPEQQAVVEEMTRSLVNKILHMPLTQMKRLPQEPDGLKFIEFLRRTFQLKD
ncbi:glutamyl-tRNA reductase [Acidobacteriia bacterium AH_259_A11_L15]|nr:glutamyl-tRNA reductase [Acidobacteriia bacterium AH_259_A11_L15]